MSDPDSPPDDLSLDPPARIGRWEIARRIGSGGMATVYEAVHADLGRRAALKVLHRRLLLDREMRVRFVREGRAAARVSHPHLVPVHDAGIDGDHAYLVLELLEGETLADRLRRETKLSPIDAANLLLPIVSALAAVHAAQIVHRDIKPSNIFLEARSAGACPRLLDFGTSRFTDGGADDAGLTRTRSILGTPAYMSPEQADGAKCVDARADQFAIGAVLYECVAGRRAFDASSWQRTLVAVIHADYPPVRKIAPHVPPALERVIVRAMALAADDRFADMRELGAALAAATGRAALEQWAALERNLPVPAARAQVNRSTARANRIARMWLVLLALVGLAVTAPLALRASASDRGVAGPAPTPLRSGRATHASVSIDTRSTLPTPAMPPPGLFEPASRSLPVFAPAASRAVPIPVRHATHVPRINAPFATPVAAQTDAPPSSSTAAPTPPDDPRVLGRGANRAFILAH